MVLVPPPPFLNSVLPSNLISPHSLCSDTGIHCSPVASLGGYLHFPQTLGRGSTPAWAHSGGPACAPRPARLPLAQPGLQQSLGAGSTRGMLEPMPRSIPRQKSPQGSCVPALTHHAAPQRGQRGAEDPPALLRGPLGWASASPTPSRLPWGRSQVSSGCWCQCHRQHARTRLVLREKFPSGMGKRCWSRSGFLCRESRADDLEYKMEEGNAWWLLGTAARGGNVPPARAAGSRCAQDTTGVGLEADHGAGSQQRLGWQLMVPSRGGRWEPAVGFDPGAVPPAQVWWCSGLARSPVQDKNCPCTSTTTG